MNIDSCLPFIIISLLLKIQSHYLKMLFHKGTPDHALESHALKHELDKHAGGHFDSIYVPAGSTDVFGYKSKDALIKLH